MASATPKMTYKPGEKIPKAGIYRAVHDTHREPHEVIFKKEKLFPPCKQCDSRVRFELLSSVEGNP
jgi:hypothetical protein